MNFLLWMWVGKAEATTYGTLYSVEEMTDLAHDVISGTVTDLESRHEEGLIKTEVSVQIEHNFVGNKQRQFAFDILGGTVDGVTMQVPGSPSFSEGQKVLLFLDHEQVVGFGQGSYVIGPERMATRNLKGARVVDSATPLSNTLDLELDLPDETQARSCLEVKVWEDYDDEWTLRSVDVDHIATGEFKSYPLTLLAGMDYEFLSCTDEKTDSTQLTLYDVDGTEITSVYERGREATLLYKSEQTQTVILSIQVEIDNDETKQVGTSLGVLYK